MDDYIGNIDLMFDFFNRLGFDWEMSEEIFDTGAPASLTNFETPEGIDADYPTASWMAVNKSLIRRCLVLSWALADLTSIMYIMPSSKLASRS